MDGSPVADLRRDDFEVVEDGVVQSIDAFEHVIIRGVGQDQRGREPSTVAASRALVENPRARVFVLFLDAYHVSVEGSASIRAPLTRTLDRLIGPEDLFGVMTPEMSARDVAFARKTTTIAGILERHWTWGERFQLVQRDAEDNRYLQCYPGAKPPPGCLDDKGIAEEMTNRRRERRSLDALRDLVRSLRDVREERKAVLVFSDGWQLFRPNDTLARTVNCQVPGRPAVGVDAGGRLTAKPADSQSADLSSCDRDRNRLARLDNDKEFRDMLEDANRGNAALYPVDPRGLAVFDEPISVPNSQGGASRPGAPPSVDSPRLNARLDSLRTMAAETDGLAIIGSNDLDGGLKRVVDDLSSYYLLGYYSTGKLDGRFHSIQVRVKRPGVHIRARRGYRAPTVAEANARATPSTTTSPASGASTADARALDAALAGLRAFGREVPLRLQAAAAVTSSRASAITIVGEVGSGEEWKAGADADVMLVAPSGDTVATGRAAIAPGTRGFLATLVPSQPLAAGQYTARVRVRGRAATAQSANDFLRLTLGSAPSAAGAVFIRRSANREAPTADPRFRRTEQLRIEIPAAVDETATARLLDRTGKPMPVPISVAARDADGVRWHTAQVALAPLAAGDYVIEVSTAAGGVGTPALTGVETIARQMLAFRVLP
jgi:VWFA-related protein